MTKPVTIVIINYETSAFVRRCVESLQREQYPHEIVIVDNPSPAEDYRNLPPSTPNLTVIRAQKNLGYGLGCNLGATSASHESGYICILNPDTAIPPGQLQYWIESYNRHCPNGGILGPALHNDNGSIQRSAYKFINGLNYWLTHSLLAGFLINRKKGSWTGGKGRGFSDASTPDQTIFTSPGNLVESPRPTDWLMGAALLLDLKTWNVLGGFSDKYFLYSEDTDLCWRARNAGFPVIYDPDVHIWHSQGDPSADARETGIVRLFDGLKLFTDLNYSGIRKSGMYLAVITDMLLRLAIMIPLQLSRKSDPLLQSRIRGYQKVLSRWAGAA